MTRAAILVALALLAGPASAAAQTYPTLTQPVNDFAGVIDASSKAELDRRIRSLEAGTPKHDAVVVVTIDTFAPSPTIEQYATHLFERAGIGQKGQNNGLLVLLAKTERQVRIEVGYDLEEFVPDGYAGDTIRQEMLPRFRNGDYGGGLLAGTTRLINRIADKRGVTLTDVPKPAASQGNDGANFLRSLPFILFVLFILLRMLSRRGPGSRLRRGGWGGWGGPFIGGFGGGGFGGGGFGGGGFGGGGGGFGGFGGGMSGGGGASGRW
jgi:uncharacterized protein